MSLPRFRWVSASKGARCHNAKCEEPAIANRLCAFHNAMWMSLNHEPPMPVYGDKPKSVLEGLLEEKLKAREMVESISSWPIHTTSDVRQLREAKNQCEALVRVWTKRRNADQEPFEVWVRKIDKAYEPIIQSCSDAAEIAAQRIEQAKQAGHNIVDDEDPDPHPTTPPGKKRRAG